MGRRNLSIQEAVLKMQISNHIYGSRIRNFVYWHTTRFLTSASRASNFSVVKKAENDFKKYLSIYKNLSSQPLQKEWADKLKKSWEELQLLGEALLKETKEIETSSGNKSHIDNLLMSFQNKLDEIDTFINDNLARRSIEEIEEEITLAKKGKKRAIFFLILGLGVSVFLGGVIAFWGSKRLVLERRKSQNLLRQMINIEHSERENLSWQLHNELGQDLSALKIDLGIIEENLKDLEALPGEVRERLREAKEILSLLMEKAHNIAQFLRPSSLDEVGLKETLENLITQHRRMTGYNYRYIKPPGPLKLSPSKSLFLYRATQELLTNIAKHSRAQNVEVRLGEERGWVSLRVKDDGIGFDIRKFLKKSSQERLGLLGLRERAGLLGGRMEIKSKPSEGMEIEIKLPSG